jgi:paraquat-inducible protein A
VPHPVDKRELCDCYACGRLQFIPQLAPNAIARCARCRTPLRQARREPLKRPFAFAVAGLLLFGSVIALQFMSIEIFGRGHAATLLSFPSQLTDDGYWELAGLFLLFILVFPPLKLLLLALVLAGLRLPHPPAVLRLLFRCYRLISPWAMVEVFLVGFFVAYTRLIGLATVAIGPAVWGLGGLMLATIGADAALDPEAVWHAIEQRCGPARTVAVAVEGRPVGCQHCGKVFPYVRRRHDHCPRCGGHVWPRKPASVMRTWALLIAACICAIGAYAYPVMTVSRLGQGAPMTIINGIIELFAIGWWPIGIIVFIASLTIPLFKLAALTTLLISVRRGSAGHLPHRTWTFRFVEVIGRWSMIDIFMVSILTALVQLGFLGNVHPDRGAIAFAAVVILTMFAANSFDPRLMWDAAARRSAAP